MRLLFVIDNLGSGGAQRQMVTLAAGLVSRGHSVELFAYYDDDHFAHLARSAGVLLHVHAKESRFSISPVRKLRTLVSTKRFDGVLAFLETPSLYAELACFGRDRPPLVVSERFCFSRSTLTWQGRIKQELHRLANKITVNSFHQRDTMVEMFPWMSPRISVIWNGVDLAYFSSQPLPPAVPGVLKVQVLASQAKKKNPLGLAKAVAICRDEYRLHIDVNWAGVSTVSSEGDAARKETDEFLVNSGLKDQWCWSGEVKDVRSLLASSDIVVHPSFAEGLPNALCEGLSSGRPILASAIGDHARLVDDGANGFLFDPAVPSDLADKLHRYSGLDFKDRFQMATSARRFAENSLSPERFVEEYENLFYLLVSKGEE